LHFRLQANWRQLSLKIKEIDFLDLGERFAETMTDQEFEIMNIVWDRGEVTVRQVHEVVAEGYRIPYTSVITILAILEGKGLLEKAVGERAYAYRAARPKEEVVGEMVTGFIARVFDGSAVALVQHLVDTGAINLDQVEEIARSGQ
jgi:predicted transcriptional regulator